MKTIYRTSLFIAMLGLSQFNQVQAKGTNLYEGIGRIAISSDGNKHDNDDMNASKMTLMILAKAGLQNKTTLYTYADHIWGNESNDLEIMKICVEGSGRCFGFNDCNFIAAVEDSTAAFNAMATEIAKSTVSDPLFIVAAGPMHVIGEGLRIANQTNPEALNYVTVISHSRWNEDHADNYSKAGSPQGEEAPHSGWTWNEMKSAFGSKVNFNAISDQNGSGTGAEAYKTKDKFSAPSWDSWAWMKNHKDPNVRWVYDKTQQLNFSCGPDYSDAGMVYYLVADLDGVRGDEFGNPEKLHQWIGEEVIPVTVDEGRVWSVTIDSNEFTLENIGDTKQLKAIVSPETATDKSVTWSSNAPSIATVSSTGLVTAVAKGNAVITATTNSGHKKTSVNVTIGSVEAGIVTVDDDLTMHI